MQGELVVKLGLSRETDEDRAVRELAAAIDQPGAGLGVFFCSSRYDLDRLATALNARFECPLLGCTSAGELSSAGGVQEGGIVGVTLSGGDITARVRMISDLHALTGDRAEALGRELLGEEGGIQTPKPSFGLILLDGLSQAEEKTIATLHSTLKGLPIVGGSAGDDLRFETTHVFAEGRFEQDAAVLCLVTTSLPFRTFKTQHFRPTGRKMVITEADPEHRRVLEIDGEPAAEAYAGILGIPVSELGPSVFSTHPVILQLGNEYFVRAIQRVEPDGSLRFFCAIDSGLVLTLAEGHSLVENLQDQLSRLERELGSIGLIIGCDCILRRLEVQSKGLTGEVEALLQRHPFIGFSTYGEQYNSIHVNQTLTGVAIGRGSP